MDRLEKYIRENASKLDSALPPEGCQEQFLARWEGERKSKRIRIFYFGVSAAAAVALLLALQPWTNYRFWGAGNNPDAVYQRYMAHVARAWEEVAVDEEASAALMSLTEEAISLRDQLPEELSPGEQAAILRTYYGDILSGIDKITDKFSNNNVL